MTPSESVGIRVTESLLPPFLDVNPTCCQISSPPNLNIPLSELDQVALDLTAWPQQVAVTGGRRGAPARASAAHRAAPTSAHDSAADRAAPASAADRGAAKASAAPRAAPASAAYAPHRLRSRSPMTRHRLRQRRRFRPPRQPLTLTTGPGRAP